MANFQPPPTWALPVLVDERTQKAIFNPIWLKWFVDLTGVLNAAGGTTPNIHNNLNSIQGGGATERYHFTSAEHAALVAGFTGTGNLVRAAGATLTTPALGTPASGTLTNCAGLPPGGLTSGVFAVPVEGTTVKASTAGGFVSSDNSAGYTGTVTTGSLVGKTITIKDGIITGFA